MGLVLARQGSVSRFLLGSGSCSPPFHPPSSPHPADRCTHALVFCPLCLNLQGPSHSTRPRGNSDLAHSLLPRVQVRRRAHTQTAPRRPGSTSASIQGGANPICPFRTHDLPVRHLHQLHGDPRPPLSSAALGFCLSGANGAPGWSTLSLLCAPLSVLSHAH